MPATSPKARLARAAQTVKAVHAGHNGRLDVGPVGTNRQLYAPDNPLGLLPFEKKVKLLEEIDAYARAKDPRVRQVMGSISGSWSAIQIIRGDGTPHGRYPPAGAPQHLGHGRRERPHGDGLLRLRRPRHL